MYCKNCGAYVDDNAPFCGQCGCANNAANGGMNNAPAAPVYSAPKAPSYSAPAPVYSAPAAPVNNAAESMATGVLVWGILGLAFSSSFYLSLLGIIFSIIAQNKVKAYQNCGGILSGKTKVGAILAKIGLIVGIVSTALFALYIMFVVLAAIASAL